MVEKKWNIYPIENPCPKEWPGQWYGFCKVEDSSNHGQAHENMLAAYVGVEQAREAIRNYRGR